MFHPALFGSKNEEIKERVRVNVTNDLGMITLINTEAENLDGSSRQKNLQKCVRLHDSSEWISFDHRQIRGEECVVAVHDKETRSGDSKQIDIGIIGEVPKNIIAELRATKAERVYFFLDNPEFSAATLENGKKGVGIALRAKITWSAYEDEVAHLERR